MGEGLGARQLAVLARGRVVGHLRRAAFEPHDPVGPLDLAREHELGDDRLDRDSAFEHDLDEGLAHTAQGGERACSTPRSSIASCLRGELDRTLTQSADRLGYGRTRDLAVPVTSRWTPTAVMKPTPSR